jgi:hypothetical protein
VVAGNAHAFICSNDEECAASAVKEARNPATNFLWTQLRALASVLEQRSWHRRALSRAEVAAGSFGQTTGSSAGAKADTVALPLKGNAVQELSEEEEGEVDLEPIVLDTEHSSEVSREEASRLVPVSKPGGGRNSMEQSGRETDALQSHPIQLDLADCAVPGEDSGSDEQQANGQPGDAVQDRVVMESALNGRPKSHAAASSASVEELDRAESQEAGMPGDQQGNHTERDGETEARNAAGQQDASATEQRGPLPESPADILAREQEVAARDEALLEEVLRRTDESIGRVYDALPQNALLLVVAGHGDTADVRRRQVRCLEALHGLFWEWQAGYFLPETRSNVVHCFRES